MAHFAVIKEGVIVGSYEVDDAGQIALDKGQSTAPWDKAIKKNELSKELKPPSEDDTTARRPLTIRQILRAVNELGHREAWEAWLPSQSRNTQDFFALGGVTLDDNPKLARGLKAIKEDPKTFAALARTL